MTRPRAMGERQRFERWVAGFSGLAMAFIRGSRCDDNAYSSDRLDWAWAAWQARAKQGRK